MCLYCIGKVEIAEKNIRTYKEVLTFKNEKDVWYPIVMTQRGAHKFNQTLIASKVIYTNIGITYMPIEHLNPYPGKYDHRMLICEGFHSHTVRLPNTKICIIPKNSEYCIGEDLEIVSNKIIVFNNRWNYWMWILHNIFEDKK